MDKAATLSLEFNILSKAADSPGDFCWRKSPLWGSFVVWSVLVMNRGMDAHTILSSIAEGEEYEDNMTMNAEAWLRLTYATNTKFGLETPMAWHKTDWAHAKMKAMFNQVSSVRSLSLRCR
jgi:hypothetical protein